VFDVDLVRRLHLEVLYDPLRSIHCVSVLLLEVWCSPAGLYRFLGAVSASLFAVRVCSVVREGGSLLCRSIVRESVLTVLVLYRACWLAVIAMVGCAVAASLVLLVWSLAMPVVLARVRVPPSRDSEMIMSVCCTFSMSWCIVSRSASGVVGRSLHMCCPSVDAWACPVSAVTSIQIRVFPGLICGVWFLVLRVGGVRDGVVLGVVPALYREVSSVAADPSRSVVILQILHVAGGSCAACSLPRDGSIFSTEEAAVGWCVPDLLCILRAQVLS
jgi:hypothetical protein